jgi:uncharacterized membrane protein
MIRSLLMGVVAGARSMTPLAAVTAAARAGRLPDGGRHFVLGNPLVVFGAEAMAAAEIAGDKMKTAPGRIIAPGIAARLASGAIAGAALAPRGGKFAGGAVGAVAAFVSGYVTFNLRMRALRRYGQTNSGLVEDAIVVSTARLIA